MSLRKKLTYRSTLLFFGTMAFIVLGTYLLFQYSTEQAYRTKLLGIANLAASFYLEKDEVNDVTHQKTERKFKRISNELIQIYHADTKAVYIDNSLQLENLDYILTQTIKNGIFAFKEENRQLLGLFYKDNEGDFVILVSGEDLQGRKQIILLIQMLVLFGLLGTIMHFFLTKILAQKTFKPFNDLIRQVNSIKGDDFDKRLEYPDEDDEINQLINEFNYLLRRIESSFMIQKNFLRNASHEIKTPLAIIIGDIEVALSKDRSIEEYKNLLQALRMSSLHLKSILEGLITLSNLETTSNKLIQDVRIDEIIWSILDKKKIEYPDRKVIINFKTGIDTQEDLLEIKGNRDLLFVAINNIIDNALKFSADKPVELIIDTLSDNLKISIIDHGGGIEKEEIEKIFDLFYRSKKTSHIPGHGIGLYLTKQILNRHNIEIQISSTKPGGTTMHLIFP